MPRLGKRKRDVLARTREDSLGKPRLADLAVGASWLPPYWIRQHADELRKSAESQVGDMRRWISESVIVAAENVSEYLFAVSPQEEWDFTSDFPCCAPPFPRSFLEFRRPSRIFSEGDVRDAGNIPPSWGWIISAETRDEFAESLRDPALVEDQIAGLKKNVEWLSRAADHSAIMSAMRSSDPRSAFEKLGNTERTLVHMAAALHLAADPAALVAAMLPDDDPTAWVLKADLVIGGDPRVGGLPIGPSAQFVFHIDASGRVLDKPTMNFAGGFTREFLEVSQDVINTTSLLLFPAMLAISFMNCKNVAINAVEPNEELNRIRERRGDRPFLRYHTIDIEPMKRVLRAEGGVESVGLKKALHLVRGHFSTYTEERKLFGKVAGTFWVPSHIRGSAREGVIVSDYRVSPPVPESTP